MRQEAGRGKEGLTAEFFNLSGVETVRANMEARFHQASSYSSAGLRAGDTVKSKLLALSQQYGNAYGNYERVIRAAREEAQNQERWINICVGLGAGVLLGLGAAFVLPSTAAGAFAITANEAAIAATSSLAQAGAGVLLTEKVTSVFSVSGTDLEPEGLHPNVLQLRIWRNVTEMYRSALRMVEATRNLHLLSNAAEYLIGEIRVHVAGGETHMSEDDVLDLMVDLVTTDQAMSRYDTMLSEKLVNLRKLQERADAMSLDDYPQRRMEQDIWILWMGELSDPDILDLDEIEDYLHGDIGILGPGSILGVDFGLWTSEEDEREARDAARRKALSIQARLRRLEGESLKD